MKRKILVVSVGAFLASGYWWLPNVVFDTSRPAYDMHYEFLNGKKVAWGPRPAQWTILADPQRTTFAGREWPFRLFRPYCVRWVRAHGYELPPQEPADEVLSIVK